jgi:hypothetical protein
MIVRLRGAIAAPEMRMEETPEAEAKESGA